MKLPMADTTTKKTEKQNRDIVHPESESALFGVVFKL